MAVRGKSSFILLRDKKLQVSLVLEDNWMFLTKKREKVGIISQKKTLLILNYLVYNIGRCQIG